MDKICDYNNCSGCGACSGICPKDCISLLPDINKCGHIYPVIDNDICINCGLCVKTCPVNYPIALSEPHETYAAYALNDVICDKSSSGGLAYTLGEHIISDGGIVYGSVVEYGKNFNIHHGRCSDIDELSRTQGSKYVHSKVDRNIYRQIKKDIVEGHKVLFVGTGCEVAGVKNFLKKDYPNFYTIDIICHGVPSFQLLNEYLSDEFKVSEIRQLFFRGKKGFDIYGAYGAYGVPIYKPLKNNLYMMGFMKGLYYRDACYSCSYAKKKRSGDITLGDFWGLKKSISQPNRNSSGISVVLVNTEKGQDFLKEVIPGLRIEERPLDEAVAGNPQLQYPSKKHYASRFFKRLYPVLGFRNVARICLIREKLFYAYILPILTKIK